ncbi:MAG: Tol-Pal system protein TolB, partial [Gammaproteobacteria bacterium]|nr:Tol-Pal system protein TolB [Gammaproteobacteria bacterium]
MPKTPCSLLLSLCFTTLALRAVPAQAALDIHVTSGVRDPIPIAVAPFARAAGDEGLDVADVIQHDLEGSGRFKALPRERMPADPTQVAEVAAGTWKASGSDYLVIGRVVALEGGNLGAEFDLINTLTGQRIAGQRFVGSAGALRNAAHRVSDAVYLKILGVRGAFATRVAYVAVDGTPPAQHYQLFVADADGANQHQILESRFPL